MPKIECPICESTFGIDKTTKLGQSVSCPTCNESFHATREQLVAQKTAHPNKKPQRPPSRKPQRPPAQTRPPLIDDSTESKTTLDEAKSLTKPDPPATVAIAMAPNSHPTSVRRRKSVIPMFVLALLFIIAIGLFAVLWKIIESGHVINQADQSTPEIQSDFESPSDPNQPRAAQSSPPSTTTPKATAGGSDLPTTESTQNESTQNDSTKNKEPAVPEKQGPPSNDFPLLEPASTFWPHSQLTQTWRNLHPRLVRLIAHTPAGQREALGTVIDSRGWVVTSLRAVAGAAKIEVKQLSSNLEQIAETELLTDLVRGVIAVDEKLDLVILSVNRRFVVAFDPVRFPDKDQIAGAHRVAAPLFPSKHSRAIFREFSIDARMFFPNFNPNDQDKLSKLGLDDPAIEWATFEQVKKEAMPDTNLAGAPIFNNDGEIVAIAADVKLGDHFLAVPATHLKSMIKMAENQVLPIATINADLKSLGITSVDPNTVVESDHPLKKLETQLNQLGEACTEFEFQPKTGPQYELLQDLLRQLVELQSIVEQLPEKDEIVAEENKKFMRQIDHWFKLIHTRLGNSFSNDAAQKLNQLTIEGLKTNPDGFFLAFVTVKFTAFDGPKLNGDDAVTLELVGTNQLIAVPFTDDLPRMLPESNFLVAGYPPRKELVNLPHDGKSYPSRIASLVFVNGPYQSDD